MTISKSEMSKLIKVKLPRGIDEDEREELLEEIGEYVVSSMLDVIGDGKSPVTGKKFEKLSKGYANKEKGGNRTSNLELDGDLLDSLDYSITDKGVEIGFFDEEQAIKAYGLQTGMEGHPWLDGIAPERPTIPEKGEDFMPRIQQGVEEIIAEFLDGRED